MKPPLWPEFPPAARFDALYDVAPMTAIEAARINALLIALMLHDAGVTVDCLPLLDVRHAGGHDIIGDRSFGAEPMRVAALGRATLDGLRAGGVVGVVKHIPGHGRARVDSHLALPVVDAGRDELATDFAPFRTLNTAPMAMTAHIVYSAIDPDHCATLSPIVIGETIRRDIGFDGLLMSDDLGMKALGGTFAERTRGCLAAGCDIALHCSGDFAEMKAVAAAAGEIAPPAAARLNAAMLWATTPRAMDVARADRAARRPARQWLMPTTAMRRAAPATLTLALGAWEGPLDLLLTLARAQKVDLAQISILALVDQYLAFVAQARSLRLELAADYLVMAAWLAYLKSCLLLPPDPAADPDPHDLALRLQWQLQRLDAMREAGARLMARDRAGVDTFRRAAPRGAAPHRPAVVHRRSRRPAVGLWRHPRAPRPPGLCGRPARRAGARRGARPAGAAGRGDSRLDRPRRLSAAGADEAYRRSALASTFVAALELTRQGRTELAQADAFAPLLVRAR